MAEQNVDQDPVQKLNLSQWVRLVMIYLLIPILLFICAGDLSWWQAWVYSVIVFAAGIGGRLLAEKRHPGLLAERAKFSQAAGVKKWDKLLAPLMALTIAFPLVIVAGLDHRFGWSPTFPLWLNILGLLIIAVGYAFVVWAMVENAFFAGAVRIQVERGHVVCDTGPYRIIRHPGYAGNILPLPGIALALSSVWTLIPAAVAFGIAVVRTSLEDRALQEDLPGYREYAQRVRFRLCPWIY